MPFLGISESLFPLCIISHWLPNGNIVEYVQKHREANRFHLVSDYMIYVDKLLETPSSIGSLRKPPVVSNTYIRSVSYTAI